MIERIVDIPTRAGAMETFIAHPSEGGRFPAVVLYMDIWGIREELYDIARRVAYCVLLPDLYHRQGKVRQAFFDADGRMLSFAALSPEQKQQALAPLHQLSDDMVIEDTEALVAFADRAAAVRKGPMGCFGYCLGGRVILRVAGTFPDRFKASAGMHGTDIVTDKPDSPHRVAQRAQGELYMGFGELDAFSPPPVIAAMAESLQNRDFVYRYTIHRGIHHGYGLPDRDVYDKQSSLIDWENIFAMFRRQLG